MRMAEMLLLVSSIERAYGHTKKKIVRSACRIMLYCMYDDLVREFESYPTIKNM